MIEKNSWGKPKGLAAFSRNTNFLTLERCKRGTCESAAQVLPQPSFCAQAEKCMGSCNAFKHWFYAFMWVLYIYGLEVFVMERCCSLCSCKVCSYFCCIMPPLHVVSNDNSQILSRLQDKKTQECWTTLLLSAGTLRSQMEPHRDVMYKQEGNYGGIILTVVKNYKYK